MPEYNDLHEIVEKLVAEKNALKKDADKANAIQYGTVRFRSRAEAVRVVGEAASRQEARTPSEEW